VIPELTVEENLRVGMMSWPPHGPAGSPGRSRRRPGAPPLDEAFERFPPLAAPSPQSWPAAAVRRRAADARHRAGAAGATARACCSTRPLATAWRRGSWPQVMDLVVRLSREAGAITIILVEQKRARARSRIADHGVVAQPGPGSSPAADAGDAHHRCPRSVTTISGSSHLGACLVVEFLQFTLSGVSFRDDLRRGGAVPRG